MGATVIDAGHSPGGNGQRPDDRRGADPADGADALPEPDDEASAAAVAAAERFFAALAAWDHRALWEEFSEDARAYVINLALERGMDFDFAGRLREGTAGEEEFDEYARDLLAGIRADLGDVASSQLQFEAAAEPSAPDKLRITYLVAMSGALGDVPAAIPAGSLLMSHDGGRWRVDRLIPKPGG